MDWREALACAGRLLCLALIAAAIAVVIALSAPAHATWKPIYAKSPEAVKLWFKMAQPPEAAQKRIGIAYCCEQAERLMTKFVPSRSGDWAYYPDPDCAHAGCPLKPIPRDVVHNEPIRALDPAQDNLPEFQAMRREGVIFIYRGEPSCFWPPVPST